MRETEWEAAQTVCLWRDGSPSMRWRSRGVATEKLERADLLLLALAALLLRGGERVRLISADKQAGGRALAPQASGRGALDGLAEALGREASEDGLPPNLMLPRHCRVVLIGDFLSPLEDIRQVVARLAAVPVSGHLLQVLDPAEALLPYAGRVRFLGLERDGETIIPRVESVREWYAERLQAQQRGLSDIAAAAGFTFSVHHSDQPPETALLGLYNALTVRSRDRMTFAAPWILLGLLALPVLWWLLRVTPPAPKREAFPAIRLLAGLDRTEETSARTPWWLLALRMLAAALIVIGLARPVIDHGRLLPGTGPVLLVMDDGWASAADWSRRLQAADAVLDRAEQAGRTAVLLTTAPAANAVQPRPTPAMPVADLRARLAALRPKPWPADHAATAAALKDWRHQGAAIVYLADGLAESGDAAFASALSRIGPVSEIRADVLSTRVLLPPRANADRLIARVWQAPHAGPSPDAVVLAQSGDGRTLARVKVAFPRDASGPGGSVGEAPIMLPPEIRNQLTRLVLEGPASAASVVMLDERWRRRPVGLIAGDMAGSESPLIGQLYYLRRALGPYTEVREGDLKKLLARDLSVLILADRVVADGPEMATLTEWVEHGGVLVRFAGTRTAEHPDTLLPVHLLNGARQLGGSLTWGKPEHLAPFPPSSPFAGLPTTRDVQVNRQVLAEPTADLASHTWATLTDGTPLVTTATRGSGRIVLFHVTANADWSNLPLSGLFVDMLRRLVALSAGVARVDANAVLPPAETLDGFGQLGTPPQAARGLIASAFTTTAVSPRHPPGLYGPENGRQALNLGAALPPLTAAPPLHGAREVRLGGLSPERALGPPLVAIALALLAIDLIFSLALRGLLRWRPGLAAGAVLLMLLAPAGAR